MASQSDSVDAKEESERLKEENESLRRRVEELEQRLQSVSVSASSPKLEALPEIDESSKLNVAVFGGGSFGTALAVIAARRGHSVTMLVRNEAQCRSINDSHINPQREWLKKYKLPPSVRCTTKMEEAVDAAKTDLIIHAIPAQHTPSFLAHFAKLIPPRIPLVCTSKGIHLRSQKLLSDLIPQSLGRLDPDSERLCYLSGPSFAKEMMEQHPVAVVCAANNVEWAKMVQTALNTDRFRVYLSGDVVGVECGGALKNPLAIGAGIASGLKYGQSTLAAMVTRGAVEMQRMAMALGAKDPQTLYGLAGFGDLMLTSMCALSRNRTCGFLMGSEGLSVEDAQHRVGETVEGVVTAIVAQKLIRRHGLRCPMFDALADVLQNKLKPEDALKVIVAKKPEHEGFVSGQ